MRSILKKIVIFGSAIALASAVLSCQKNELEPAVKEDPILNIEGRFMGANWSWVIGNSTVAGVTSVNNNDSLNGRHYIFTAVDSADLFYPIITFDFVNYRKTSGNFNDDMDSTFKPGAKTLALYFNNPLNPTHTNTVSVAMQTPTYTYTSRTVTQLPGTFFIDSTKVITWKDNKEYKLVYTHFNFSMVDLFNPQDSLSIPFQNGKAVLAFPRH